MTSNSGAPSAICVSTPPSTRSWIAGTGAEVTRQRRVRYPASTAARERSRSSSRRSSLAFDRDRLRGGSAVAIGDLHRRPPVSNSRTTADRVPDEETSPRESTSESVHADGDAGDPRDLRHRSFWIINTVLFFGALAAVVLPSLLSSGTDVERVRHEGGSDGLRRERARDSRAGRDRAVRQREPPGRGEAADRRRHAPTLQSSTAPNRSCSSVPASTQRSSRPLSRRSVQHHGAAPAAKRRFRRPRGEGPAARSTRGGRRTPRGQRHAPGRRGDRRDVLYLLLIGLTISVANGVAIEKSNRISEVLLAIVPPRPLLFGKVAGVGIMGLATLAFGVVPVVVRVLLGGGLPSGFGPRPSPRARPGSRWASPSTS